MPIFFGWRHIIIIAASFHLLHEVFSKTMGVLRLMMMKAADFRFVIPNNLFAGVALDAALYGLTLAAVMMLSFRHIQLVFTEDKFSFSAMDIRHRPFQDFLRYAKFGFLFCIMRFVAILMLFFPFAALQILSEHGIIDITMLRMIPKLIVTYPVISILAEIAITAFVLRVLVEQKYLKKRLCLIQHSA